MRKYEKPIIEYESPTVAFTTMWDKESDLT